MNVAALSLPLSLSYFHIVFAQAIESLEALPSFTLFLFFPVHVRLQKNIPAACFSLSHLHLFGFSIENTLKKNHPYTAQDLKLGRDMQIEGETMRARIALYLFLYLFRLTRIGVGSVLQCLPPHALLCFFPLFLLFELSTKSPCFTSFLYPPPPFFPLISLWIPCLELSFIRTFAFWSTFLRIANGGTMLARNKRVLV